VNKLLEIIRRETNLIQQDMVVGRPCGTLYRTAFIGRIKKGSKTYHSLCDFDLIICSLYILNAHVIVVQLKGTEQD